MDRDARAAAASQARARAAYLQPRRDRLRPHHKVHVSAIDAAEIQATARWLGLHKCGILTMILVYATSRPETRAVVSRHIALFMRFRRWRRGRGVDFTLSIRGKRILRRVLRVLKVDGALAAKVGCRPAIVRAAWAVWKNENPDLVKEVKL